MLSSLMISKPLREDCYIQWARPAKSESIPFQLAVLIRKMFCSILFSFSAALREAQFVIL